MAKGIVGTAFRKFLISYGQKLHGKRMASLLVSRVVLTCFLTGDVLAEASLCSLLSLLPFSISFTDRSPNRRKGEFLRSYWLSMVESRHTINRTMDELLASLTCLFRTHDALFSAPALCDLCTLRSLASAAFRFKDSGASVGGGFLPLAHLVGWSLNIARDSMPN